MSQERRSTRSGSNTDLLLHDNGGNTRTTGTAKVVGDVSNLALLEEFKKFSIFQSDLKSELTTLAETMRAHMSTNTKAMSAVEERLDKLTSKLNQVCDNMAAGAEEVEAFRFQVNCTEDKVVHFSNKVDQLQERISALEAEKRRCNLFIEGLPEVANVRPIDTVLDLFADMSVNIGPADVESAARLGTSRVKGKPCPVLVKLKHSTFKKDIYSNVKRLVDLPKWSNTYINDDLTPEQRSEKHDARSIALFARTLNVDCKQRGGAVIIDGRRYPAKEFHNLPHNLSLENAKVVDFQHGCAFQGHHAYLSSMYPVPIKYNGKPYHHAKGLYQSLCAIQHEERELAERIRLEVDPYEAKRMVKLLKTSKE